MNMRISETIWHDFVQYQNYKQLGLRLCESIPSKDMVGNLLDKISKVLSFCFPTVIF